MAIPNVQFTVKNGGLGIAAANSEGIQAKVGRIRADAQDKIKELMPINSPKSFGTKDAIEAACGTGALAQAAILALEEGGGPVVVCRADETMDFQESIAGAIDALQAARVDFEMVHVVSDETFVNSVDDSEGYCNGALSATEANALVSMLDTKAKAFWNAHRYDSDMFVIEMNDADESELKSLTAASDFVAACRGFVTATNPISGATQSNPLAWHATARASAVAMGRDLAATADGPLTGVTQVAHDEASHGGMCDSTNLTTARTFPRRSGVYLTNARMLRPSGSDFEFWQHRRMMNGACAAADDYLFTLLSSSVQVNAETGLISEAAASAIEANCESAINNRVGEYISDVTVTVDRTANILSTKTIPVSVAIVPLGYIKAIEVEIGFKNPALATT